MNSKYNVTEDVSMDIVTSSMKRKNESLEQIEGVEECNEPKRALVTKRDYGVGLNDYELLNELCDMGLGESVLTIFIRPGCRSQSFNSKQYIICNEIRKCVSNVANLKTVEKTKNGTFIVTVSNAETAREVISIKSLDNIVIEKRLKREGLVTTIVVHQVITGLDLQVIYEDLYGQGICVNKVKKMRYKGNSEYEWLIVEILGKMYPKDVVIFHKKCNVKLFQKKVTICNNCCSTYHKNCSAPKICRNCSKDHAEEICPNRPFCKPCGKEHRVLEEKICPERVRIEEIYSIMNARNCSRYEATRIYHKTDINTNVSYASVTQSVNNNTSMKAIEKIITDLIYSDSFISKIASKLFEMINMKYMEDGVKTQFERTSDSLAIVGEKISGSGKDEAEVAVIENSANKKDTADVNVKKTRFVNSSELAVLSKKNLSKVANVSCDDRATSDTSAANRVSRILGKNNNGGRGSDLVNNSTFGA